MAGKASWLASGLVILGTAGPTGLTIDKLVAATGLSTGSFYHHFPGMPGYKSALLAYFEEMHTTRYLREIEAADLDPRGRLDLLIDLVLVDDEPAAIEVAVRAWALDDPIAAAAKERVDGTRLGVLRTLLADCGYAEADAEQTAQILYLLVLGAGNMLPAVPPAQLRVLCRRVLS
ncbi:TetR/AcrR family transcriptional regulator [Nocardia pseudovaccinii]|uniref:TetR/AcrR family transcriptional regulator n=1 Tax=Nocardia pseudovaccinii TaxID=189540 RepID=UPI0007A51CB7|nr:TetR/AcrR family transcriptional regulator [Nocardia pseudovaccinii]